MFDIDITDEVLHAVGYRTHKNEQKKLNAFDRAIVEERKSQAYPYVGFFPAYQISETFLLPTLTVRRMEAEKNMFYGGK